MRAHEWEGLGVHTRGYVRAGERVCALQMAKMIGFSVRAHNEHMPGVRRCDDEIYVDYGAVWRDGSMVGVREEVARELAAFVLEECDYAYTDAVIVEVAMELVFSRSEAERAWLYFNHDLEKLGDHYHDHVPSRWLSARMQAVISAQVTVLPVRSKL
jgi:hypothetical protein